MTDIDEEVIEIYFSDHFAVSPEVLSEHGAFDISLVADLPLFIDPFLLFNSQKAEYQRLHDEMIRYLRFLRDKVAERPISKGLLKAWFTFSEVKQNWLGYSKTGNAGSGLGANFAIALSSNLGTVFRSFGDEDVTAGTHLEKLTLIQSGVGRDNVSDFTTNLIKEYLLNYTQEFAVRHIDKSMRNTTTVERVRFNYSTETWEAATFDLPWYAGDFVLLTPKDILTKDEAWISRVGMFHNFPAVLRSVENEQLREQMNNYFISKLPESPKKEDTDKAIDALIRAHPEFIEWYIKYQEDHGDDAIAYSYEKVRESIALYINGVKQLVSDLRGTAFYQAPGDTRDEVRARILFLKDVIEAKGGHRYFYVDGEPVRREADLQLLFRLTWYGTASEVSREVNDGRGPVDFKVSRGARDKSLVEFKLASNSKLRRNLEKQLEIYKAASDAPHGFKVIVYFTDAEREKVIDILTELDMVDRDDVITIDARPDKPSGSKA